jgi:hypothetical protein
VRNELIGRLEEMSVELAGLRKVVADQKSALERVGRDAEKYKMLRNVIWRSLRYNEDRRGYEIDSSVVLGLSGKEALAWEELVDGTPRTAVQEPTPCE